MSVTVVSCYYLVRSKHSIGSYKEWTENFFTTFEGNIILFTNEETKEHLSKIIDYPSEKIKYIIKDLYETEICKKYDDKFWRHQRRMDDPIINSHRTKECYIIWNSKFNFLKEAIELNPFQSDKFIWNDIGSLRVKKDINSYPNYQKIEPEKLTVVCVNDNFQKEYYRDESNLSGAIFGGSKEIILELEKLYYEAFDDYVSKKMFIGDDQQILSTVYYRNKDKFNLIKPQVRDWFHLYDYWV